LDVAAAGIDKNDPCAENLRATWVLIRFWTKNGRYQGYYCQHRRISAGVIAGSDMLIELFGQNFGCFRDAFRLSMLAADIDPSSDRGIVNVSVKGDSEPLRLLRAVALYGPNGSGKSTVLRAAGVLSELLSISWRLSSDSPIRPYEPFALGPLSNAPVVLGIKAVIDGHVYEYSISYVTNAFVSERLIRRSSNEEQVLIDRDRQMVGGDWTTDPQFKLVSKDFRPNALLLSLADSLAPGLAKNIAVSIRRLLSTSGHGMEPLGQVEPLWWSGRFSQGEEVAQRARDDSAFGEWLLTRLRSADVGVVGVKQEEVRREPNQWSIFEMMEFERRVASSDIVDDSSLPRKAKRSLFRLKLLHGSATGAVALPYSRESLGTRRIVELSPLLYDLTHGDKFRAAFVDEIDASMHPLLLQGLLQHFNSEINPHGIHGQLIFATHETTLLDAEAKHAVLRRDQIYLTEKDSNGSARLYSVAEFRERNNLNIRRRYLQGRYGALPALGTFAE
jgi:uncharacterized protein